MNSNSPESVPDDLATTLSEYASQLYTARREYVKLNDDFDYDEWATELTPPERDAFDTLEADGFSLVGVGAGRCVAHLPDEYDLPNCVVKFARYGPDEDPDNNGRLQNNHEAHLYTTLTEHGYDEFRLIPLVDDGDGWVVQMAITPFHDDPDAPDNWEELRNALYGNLSALGDNLHLPEITPKNTAMWDGDLYLFDYGSPPREPEAAN